MSLPTIVGDQLQAMLVTIKTTNQPQAIADVNERYESVLSVGLKAYAANGATIYVGNKNSQPVEIAAGQMVTINISRASQVYVKGTKGDKLGVLIVRTTGEASTPVGA